MSNINTIRLVFYGSFILPAFPEHLLDRYDTIIFAVIVSEEEILLYIVSLTNSVAEAYTEVIHIFYNIIVLTTTDTVEDRIEVSENVRQSSIFTIIIPLAIVHEWQLRHDAEVISTLRYTTSGQTVFTEEEVVSQLEFMSVLTDIELGNNVNISINDNEYPDCNISS